MAVGATGTPTVNFAIPTYAVSADAPSGQGFNSTMAFLDTLLKTQLDAKLGVFGTPTNGQAPVWSTANNRAEWAVAASPSVTPIELRNAWVSGDIGNSYWTVGTLSNRGDVGHWEYVKDVEGIVVGYVKVPTGVTSAKIRLALIAAATSGVTRFTIMQCVAVADGEDYNIAGSDGTAQDITVPGTANMRKDVLFDIPVTIAGGDFLSFRIVHNGDHANDTLAVNTWLLGAWLEPQ